MALNLAVAMQTVVWLTGITVGLIVAITNGTKIWKRLRLASITRDVEIAEPDIAKLASRFIHVFVCSMDVSMSTLIGVWALSSLQLWWVDDSNEANANRVCLPPDLKSLIIFLFMIIVSGFAVFMRRDHIYDGWKRMTNAGLFEPVNNPSPTAARCGSVKKVISACIVSVISFGGSAFWFAIVSVLLLYMFVCSLLPEMTPMFWMLCFENREVPFPITGCILIVAAALALTIGHTGHNIQTTICDLYGGEKRRMNGKLGTPPRGANTTREHPDAQTPNDSVISEKPIHGFQMTNEQLFTVDCDHIGRIMHTTFVSLLPWLSVFVYLVWFDLQVQCPYIRGLGYFVVWVNSCSICIWYFVFYLLSPNYMN